MKKRPRIIVSQQDANRLEDILSNHSGDPSPNITELEEELGRAVIVDAKDIPPNVVTMNSTISFRTSSSKDVLCLTLVYPEYIDKSGRTISILAPVGGALLGLTEGESIEWPRPGGGILEVTIEKIVYQPERSGEYDR